jgi:hypothetical protein
VREIEAVNPWERVLNHGDYNYILIVFPSLSNSEGVIELFTMKLLRGTFSPGSTKAYLVYF